MLLKKLILLAFLPVLLFLSSCKSAGKIWDPAPVSETPTDVDERVKRNIEEGRGFKLMDKRDNAGVGAFASNNPVWRATLDTLDFMVLSSADYGGGIIITDWYSENNNEESIKITIRFLSTEIRADGFDVIIHQKKCNPNNFSDCSINKLNTKLEEDIKLAILKRAVIIDKKLTDKKVKEFKKQFPDYKKTGKASAN